MFKKPQKETLKHVKKGVYQRLGVTLKRWLTPISWLTPEQYVCFSIRKSVSTNERRAEHSFPGRNTQQMIFDQQS